MELREYSIQNLLENLLSLEGRLIPIFLNEWKAISRAADSCKYPKKRG
jgi:hypothetical protein